MPRSQPEEMLRTLERFAEQPMKPLTPGEIAGRSKRELARDQLKTFFSRFLELGSPGTGHGHGGALPQGAWVEGVEGPRTTRRRIAEVAGDEGAVSASARAFLGALAFTNRFASGRSSFSLTGAAGAARAAVGRRPLIRS